MKTGVTTAVDGVVQAGSSGATLVRDGSSDAEQRWEEKGDATKATARKGREETRHESRVPRCR